MSKLVTEHVFRSPSCAGATIRNTDLETLKREVAKFEMGMPSNATLPAGNWWKTTWDKCLTTRQVEAHLARSPNPARAGLCAGVNADKKPCKLTAGPSGYCKYHGRTI